MIKRFYIKKLIMSSLVLIIILTLYFIPNQKDKLEIEEKISHVNYNLETNEIYLLDNNNYLSRKKIATEKTNEELVYEILEILICDGAGEDKIPNGFKCTINSETKINSVSLKNNTLKIDFSKALLDVQKEKEEQIIESIVYSLTGIDGINNIIIYIDGKILTTLPKSNITLPSTLTRDFGINKKYSLTSNHHIKKTTIYYLNTFNNETYYTPITLVNNDERDKIEIIIDELSNKIPDDNLSSYLHNDTKVLNSYIKNETMYIDFNNNILNDFDNNSILEEVIYTISLSINDNYDIKNVFFSVNNKEIIKTTIKSLE